MIANALNNEAVYNAVALYLSTGDSWLAKAAHIAVMVAEGTMLGYQKLGYPDLLQALSPKPNVVTQTLDLASRVLADPNIEGIVIHSPRMDCGRRVDVSESPTIVQAGFKKEYNVDNAVPHLQTWQFQGYLTSIDPLIDVGQTLKPSLAAQYIFLDACAVSRRPVWFKDANNIFHRCLITQIQGQQVPNITNALTVSIGLIEYRPIEIETDYILGRVAETMAQDEDTTKSVIDSASSAGEVVH